MDIQVIFQVAEVSFDPICGLWYIRVGQIMKHIWQGPFDGYI
jgi:hypothetical protein